MQYYIVIYIESQNHSMTKPEAMIKHTIQYVSNNVHCTVHGSANRKCRGGLSPVAFADLVVQYRGKS